MCGFTTSIGKRNCPGTERIPTGIQCFHTAWNNHAVKTLISKTYRSNVIKYWLVVSIYSLKNMSLKLENPNGEHVLWFMKWVGKWSFCRDICFPFCRGTFKGDVPPSSYVAFLYCPHSVWPSSFPCTPPAPLVGGRGLFAWNDPIQWKNGIHQEGNQKWGQHCSCLSNFNKLKIFCWNPILIFIDLSSMEANSNCDSEAKFGRRCQSLSHLPESTDKA